VPLYNSQPISREDVGALFLQPVESASLAFRTSTTVRTSGHEFRIPVLNADPTAAFVAEGSEIAVSDPTLSELTVIPRKVAGLVVISSELANDSSPAAAEVVGDGLSRDVARKIDAAWFGAMLAPAPSGLNALAGTTAVSAGSTAGGTVWTNLDPVAEAISRAEEVGATVNALVCSPATALRIAKLKTAPTGSNQPLVNGDVTQPGERRIFGVPLFVSPDVAADVMWAYDSSKVYTVLREDAEITTDSSVFYTSDRVAVRGIARVGFAFPLAASVVKIAPVA
jgi:HK97 family phage major capsid protein